MLNQSPRSNSCRLVEIATGNDADVVSDEGLYRRIETTASPLISTQDKDEVLCNVLCQVNVPGFAPRVRMERYHGILDRHGVHDRVHIGAAQADSSHTNATYTHIAESTFIGRPFYHL